MIFYRTISTDYASDYSSSDHFTSDDSLRDSPSDSSSETSSDSSSRHSSLGHPLSNSLCDSLTATFAGPSRKRCRYSDSKTDFEVSSEEGYVPYVPREIGLGVKVKDSYEPYTEPNINLDVQADIHACIAFADEIAARETDADRVTHLVVSDDTVEPVGEDSPETMPTATRSGMTQDAINELIAKHVEKALKAYDAAKNPRTEMEMENEQQDDNVEANGGNGNGNGNSNGIPNMNNGGVIPVTRECTYQDFVKYQPLNFKRTEEVVGLTRWFEKWKRTVGVDAAYAMTWKALMKLMTKRFQELTLFCTKMVLEEEDQVKKYIGGLLDNIHGNVIAAEPIRLQDEIRITNNLIDQKLKGYAIKNAKNKRRFDNSSRGNCGQQQQPFKRQNINGQNMARSYTVGNNIERRGYAGALPYYNKCRMHHEGPYMVKCGNCKKVGHVIRDYRTTVAATT
ncbi:hypothetical protein Tco_0699639 [Tanacetum coccineum]